MTSITLAAFVQVSLLGAGQQDFDQAYQQSLTTRRPLVVLVGARWCPACQKMRNSILPQVARTGGLKNVVFSYVDFDQQRQLASRLSRGTSIPQLIRFDQTPAGWDSKYLVGARSPREVYEFINAGLIDESKVSKVSVADRPRDDPRKSARAESVRSTPAVSESGTYSSVDAARRPQSEAGPFPVEKADRFSHWMLFFDRLFPERKNWGDSAERKQDRSRQVREDRESGAPTKQRKVGADGSESEGVGPDIAGSLSRLVWGSTVSRRNSPTSNHLQQQE